MLDRKDELFAEYTWSIVAFQVREEKDKIHVEVMAEVGYVTEENFAAAKERIIILPPRR